MFSILNHSKEIPTQICPQIWSWLCLQMSQNHSKEIPTQIWPPNLVMPVLENVSEPLKSNSYTDLAPKFGHGCACKCLRTTKKKYLHRFGPQIWSWLCLQMSRNHSKEIPTQIWPPHLVMAVLANVSEPCNANPASRKHEARHCFQSLSEPSMVSNMIHSVG